MIRTEIATPRRKGTELCSFSQQNMVDGNPQTAGTHWPCRNGPRRMVQIVPPFELHHPTTPRGSIEIPQQYHRLIFRRISQRPMCDFLFVLAESRLPRLDHMHDTKTYRPHTWDLQ